MKKYNILVIIFISILISGCGWSEMSNDAKRSYRKLTGDTACEKTGGEIIVKEECDGTKTQWCKISDQEQCYDDQVKDGKCTAGEYDPNTGAIVGIMSKVVCQSPQEELGGLILPPVQPAEQSECEKSGGRIEPKPECDGSSSQWCLISDREQCYADQVKDGKCTVGTYDESAGGIVGITPKVLCDNPEAGQ